MSLAEYNVRSFERVGSNTIETFKGKRPSVFIKLPLKGSQLAAQVWESMKISQIC